MQITPVSNVKLLNMEMIMTGDYEHLNPDMGEAQSYLLAFKDPPPLLVCRGGFFCHHQLVSTN
jgi:hypothetical protein